MVEVGHPDALGGQQRGERAAGFRRAELVEVLVALRLVEQDALVRPAQVQAAAVLLVAARHEERVGAQLPQAPEQRVGGDLRPALRNGGVGVGHDGDPAPAARGADATPRRTETHPHPPTGIRPKAPT